MKRIGFYFLFLLFLLPACLPDKADKDEPGDSDIDAARDFIQAALRGNFKSAANYMLHDSANDERLDAVARMPRSADEKQGLWDATINIHERKLLNDSVSIIVYSNSYYKNNRDTLRVVKKDGAWLVDFKYLFDAHK
ncbi:hypothetical protein [Niabella drilacis]|uniref:DUF4878 domain-containing protein n=1 Tax=Niabella drilacis (strain DSM 25811 / CCM 8410 / CCUG 62505 / LMG 26954 / E90) TaxID=1285928 RepID=A0A1G6VGK3_NIADE|nr:hypothetical protein [Niabella drilacis]SDD52810.1 hypothetical protein SAMN04487894_11017 [Niabella drilacis]